MSEDTFGFAPPPFRPSEALTRLKRDLRELRGLSERGAGFEWKSLPALVLGIDDGAIRAQLAKKPARSPAWEARLLKSGADVRRFLADVRQRMARWDDED